MSIASQVVILFLVVQQQPVFQQQQQFVLAICHPSTHSSTTASPRHSPDRSARPVKRLVQ